MSSHSVNSESDPLAALSDEAYHALRLACVEEVLAAHTPPAVLDELLVERALCTLPSALGGGEVLHQRGCSQVGTDQEYTTQSLAAWWSPTPRGNVHACIPARVTGALYSGITRERLASTFRALEELRADHAALVEMRPVRLWSLLSLIDTPIGPLHRMQQIASRALQTRLSVLPAAALAAIIVSGAEEVLLTPAQVARPSLSPDEGAPMVLLASSDVYGLLIALWSGAAQIGAAHLLTLVTSADATILLGALGGGRSEPAQVAVGRMSAEEMVITYEQYVSALEDAPVQGVLGHALSCTQRALEEAVETARCALA